MSHYIVVLLSFSFLVSACSKTPDEQEVQSTLAASDYDSSVGWLHGNCLAIKNLNLTSGTAIIVVQPNQPQIISHATISGRANSSETCKALLDDRRKVNRENGYTFYTVDSKPEINLGIAVLGTNNTLDDYGFDYCSTQEGVVFTLNARPEHGGAELWRGYYYLGYESEPTCPASNNSPAN